MADAILMLGLEITAALTLALLAVAALRGPVRAVFGARAAYCLWWLAPMVLLAVALPRAAAPVPAETPAVAATPAGAAPSPPPVAEAAPARPLVTLERPAFVPNPRELAAPLLALWALGALVWAVILVRDQRRFLDGLGPLRPEERADGRVFHASRPDVGPALVGAWAPRVVLPGDFAQRFSPEEQAAVVAHERVHLKGGDAQINLAVAGARVVFWFNPVVHLAARLIRVDQELACDETVIARDPGVRRFYAEAMLKTQFASAPAPLGCHWQAGGKGELRRRILRLKRAPAPGRRMAGAAAAAALVLGGGAAAWAMQPATPAAPDEPRVSTSTRDLLQAIQDGRNTRALQLVEAGADVNGWVLGDGSPLLLAVRDGQLRLAEVLLERGADPDLAVLGEGAPLIAAADQGDETMVRLLLARGANPNLAVSGDGNPLIAASAGGHVEVLNLLLAAGAEVDAVVVNDETALITAARHGQFEAVRRLVEAGADVNLAVMAPRLAQPPELRSPLNMARRSGRTEIVDYLLAHGARRT